MVVSYLPHLLVMALVLPALWRVLETVHQAAGSGPRLAARMRIAGVAHPRFLRIAVLTLGVGILVQPIARRLDREEKPRGALVGLSLAGAGLLMAALAADLSNPLAVVAAAIVLGAAHGFSLVGGLLEVERIAGPDELAGLNAAFYGLTLVADTITGRNFPVTSKARSKRGRIHGRRPGGPGDAAVPTDLYESEDEVSTMTESRWRYSSAPRCPSGTTRSTDP